MLWSCMHKFGDEACEGMENWDDSREAHNQASEIHTQKRDTKYYTHLSSGTEFFHSLVRVTSIEVKRNYIFPPGALSILSVLVLESEETPNGPPK